MIFFSVKLSPAQGSQPDSGVDNTEDQEQEKRAMVEKWSEDAARHTGEWTEDPNGESGLCACAEGVK